MLLAAEVVGDIVVVGLGLARNVLTTLNVASLHWLAADPKATGLGAYRTPRDRAADGGDILTASAADLVAENAADHGADHRS
jgi:hypothetical protein